MDEFVYNVEDKDKCWYLNICDKSKCGTNFCVRHYKMSYLIYLSLIEGKHKYPKKLKLEVDSPDRDSYLQLQNIRNNIGDFVANGKNLFIYSKNTGNGKTSWAVRLLLSWLDSIWSTTELECRALFISLPKLMAAMKSNIEKPNEYFQYVDEHIVKADLVIWDEFYYKNYSTFEHDYLLNILSQRLVLGKSNIYTTNCDLLEMESKLGTRLSSRILGDSTKIELKGRDMRGVV